MSESEAVGARNKEREREVDEYVENHRSNSEERAKEDHGGKLCVCSVKETMRVQETSATRGARVVRVGRRWAESGCGSSCVLGEVRPRAGL